MKRIKFLAMLVLLTFVGRAFADNLKVNDITLNAGATQEIAIELINPDKTYTAFQFDLVLPEGITIAKNARNKLIASLNADRIDDQTLNVSEVGNNTYRFISFSMSNAEFYDAEGALVYVTLAAAQDITGGTKVATIASQVITEVSGDQYKWDDLSFNIAVPSAGIPIDATNFPDENFRNYLLSQDYGQDALLTEEEIEGRTVEIVSGRGIADLTGIELFTNLVSLYCNNNQLTSLDVTKNTALQYLNCSKNQLTSLDVSNNVELGALSCCYNQLTSLDVSKNVALTYLECYNNQLTSLDVSNNVALQELYCSHNQLTSLDLTNNVALTRLDCTCNQISGTGMDELISSLPTIASGRLYAIGLPEWGEGNEITPAQVAAANAKGWKVFQIDAETREWVEMSGEVAPTGIAIDATNFPDENFRAWLLSQDYGQDALLTEEEIAGITGINVSEKEIANLTGIELFTNLTFLNCSSNRLTSLDLTNNDALKRVYCSVNQIKDSAMDELISSLPTVDSGRLNAMNPLESGEGNKITPAQVAAANAKGWKVFQYQYGHGWVEMSDEEPPAGIAIDATNFPDDNFRAWLLRQDYGQDGVLTEEEIQAVTEIDVHQKGISVLKGIEFFTALTTLECSSNQLTSLDVSLNTALVGLYCNVNQLTSLDVSNNTALQNLSCSENQLTSLDVTKNVKLEFLNCEANKLTSLDVSKNTALQNLSCSENQLTSLDVTKNVKLEFLNCEANKLTSLDVSYNTALVILYCDNNQLTSLDVTTNTALTTLTCIDNQLMSLDVSKNVALEYLNCEANKLTSLDVSYNTALVRLLCGHNQLTSLDVTKNVALTLLFCYNNQLKSLDVTNNVALTVLSIICNQISGTEMDKLVSSLPSIDYGTLFAIDYTQEEGNVVTPKQVSAANARGWKVTRWDAETERYVEMSGEDPDGIQSTDKGSLTVDDAVIYNLSGQRLSKPQRGVNIINGKKMVVK